ncbi:hypothetical protein KKC83_04095 [Patescibacteria group bacterium]|nr:hypothetical protein [Candidatus Falkowbacteria bacterium]MBU3905905.1 hypothetical protein [Patescibacteria group bacterium]MCG2698158.1 hypothetical protein [Candidatus Parcubacteria bacterium]MBU4014729.1 hypothetical protein [Patescibacteria group bacterium]MBU4026696.1 hypothetical protein [Patescibacteria group bacterium]
MRILWLKFLNYFNLSNKISLNSAFDLLGFIYVRIYLIALISLNSLNWAVAFFINKNVSQELVFLHYNVNFGVDLIGDVSRVYIIPLLGFIFILTNFILLTFIHKHGKFIVHLLFGAALMANLFLLAAIASVYLINFR